MELYSWMKNIRNLNQEEIIIKSIATVKKELENLTEERMCLLYSSYIWEELRKNNLSARIISTKDLGYDYEHRFVLVPSNKEQTYFLIDLTFSQFENKNIELEMFKKLLDNGYQEIDNDLWSFYLGYVTRTEKNILSSLEEAFYGPIEQERRI